MLLTPIKHLIKRNTTEPIGHRSRIVTIETIGTTMIHSRHISVVGVMLPPQDRLVENLTSFTIDDIEDVLASGDATLLFVDGIGVLSGLVGTLDDLGDSVVRHK
jgi:hypothetical protein